MENPAFNGGPSAHGLDVRGMLQLARQRVDEGQPSAALQLVSLCRVTVLRAQGGEAAVLAALTRARALHHDQRQMQQLQQGADDITALLARCAIDSADVAVPAGGGQMAAGGSAMAWGGGNVGMGGNGMGDSSMGGSSMGGSSMGQPRGEGAVNGGMEGVDGYGFRPGYGAAEQAASYGMLPTEAGYGVDQAGRQGIDPAAAAYGMDQSGRHGVDGAAILAGQGRMQVMADAGFGAPHDTAAAGFGMGGHGVDGAAILAEQGRMQVVADAAADGSSVTCSMCRGVISGARWKEHVQFWCRAAVHGPMADGSWSP
ncbi:unnamed protein product [Closterium sp. Yama58-4]|nr:unnamed protein product [Closterium sp. Yama58-4]